MVIVRLTSMWAYRRSGFASLIAWAAYGRNSVWPEASNGSRSGCGSNMKTPNDSSILPYDVHTNRELQFMLERGKILAHFYDAYPSEPDEEIFPEEAFALYVE